MGFLPRLSNGLASISKIYNVINRKPRINLKSGLKPDIDFSGSLWIKNVRFNYPTRPNGFTHHVEYGKSIAMVAQSGGGKSTTLQLVQRFYDPINIPENADLTRQYSESEIVTTAPPGLYMDGFNIAGLNPQWIRMHIGVVSQEPNLFDLTIRENIEYGLNFREEVKMEEVIEAAKKANAHDFIESLPQGYETMVGEKGSKLSGGQKQRIAIARALIRDPKLLILDEATSALDNESEKIVQMALDKITSNGDRTCLIVAHRLSSIENSDQIVVLSHGKKAECGSQAQLMKLKGIFYELNSFVD